jgi:GNAT superfamily N-acetyltransferase
VLDSLSSNGYIVDDDGYWYVTGEGEQYLQQALKNKAQPVAEGQLNELRDRMYQYIKSIVPTWPDYVVQDLLYANRGKGNTGNDGIPIKNDILDLLKAEGLTPNTKWQLIPNMKFSMDMWAEHTLRKLKGRVGGSSDMGMNIPRDAERHTTQAALAQQQGGVRKEPVIIIKTPQGYELLEGWHRTIQHFAMYPTGYVGPAYVAQSNQPVAEDNASPTKISFKVKKGRGRFATEMIVNGQQAGVYQYDANTGRSIAEVFPEFRSQGLGKILVLHAIYTAAKLGLDFQEDESRTAAYDNVLDSLSSNGYIVDDDGYWYVTGEGEQYLQQSLKNKAPPVAENFADGKGPGRPGDSVRHGIPKNATMAELEKASHSAGRKGQLARWQLNMRRGKAELSEIKQRLDAKCWPGTRKEGTKIKGGVRVNNCVPVSETGVKKPQLKTYAARVKLKQLGYTNIVDATVMARNPEMARRLLHQLYGGNSSVVGQPREIK